MSQNNHQPNSPKWSLKLLRFFIKKDYLEELEGDMVELFQENLKVYSVKKANRIFTLEVLKLLRPILIKRLEGTYQLNQYSMLKNYVKIGWRNIVKYKSYSVINALGLAVGITATLLLLLIINFENSFDDFHNKGENVYRVGQKMRDSGVISDLIPTPAMPAMRNEFPEILSTTRIFESIDILQYGEDYYKTHIHYVDSGFADVFSFKVLKGDLKSTLSNQNRIVLSEATANKFFGTEDPVGKVIQMINEEGNYTVGAVIENPPSNSSVKVNALVPWQNAPEWLDIDQAGNWYNTFMRGYLRLGEETDVTAFENKLIDFKESHFIAEHSSEMDVKLLPLKDEHKRISQNDQTLTILTFIAIFILIISCVNFMNLTTTQSIGRTKEIGVRKVMGSTKSQLVAQFLSESFMVSLMAVLASMLMIYFAVPLVNHYFNLDIGSIAFNNLHFFAILFFIALMSGVLSGVYPAFKISRIKAVNSIKGQIKSSKSSVVFQKTLIAVQFVCTIILISGTLIMWKQIEHMKTRELNFDGNDIIAIDNYSGMFKNPQDAVRQLKVLRNELLSESAIESITTAQCFPGAYWHNYDDFYPSVPSSVIKANLRQITVDYEYFKTMKMSIVQGRDFSKNLADSLSVIINQTAMEKYGWIDLDGKYLLAGGSEEERYKVVGVVEDYHYQSLKDDIQPMIHFYSDYVSNKMIVRFHPNQIQNGLAILERNWRKLEPYESMQYWFIDDEFDYLYKSHERIGTTASIFSAIAIMLASLGLFSIASFSIRMRRKEVGIRKTLGATVAGITILLSKKFGNLVLIAFLFSSPVVYYFSELFLADFTNRIDFDLSVLVISGICIFLVVIISVGLESIKTALLNPVDSLRDE